MQDGLNGSGIAIDVSKLTEAIFGDIILGNGQRIVVQAKLRDSRDIGGWFRSGRRHNGVNKSDGSRLRLRADDNIRPHEVGRKAAGLLVVVIPRCSQRSVQGPSCVCHPAQES